MADPHVLVPELAAARTTRHQVRQIMRQVHIGIGALLLAAVDDWNARVATYTAPMRTALTPLGRGSHIAAVLAASIEVWLATPGKHPRGHIAVKPFMWPEVSSCGNVHTVVHHDQMAPTNDRRSAFRRQDAAFLRLADDPTLCELTWDYDVLTGEKVTHIWVSAPMDCEQLWEPFEVSMKLVRAQYQRWSRRAVRWLPPTALPNVVVAPVHRAAPESQTHLPTVRIPRKKPPSGGESTAASA